MHVKSFQAQSPPVGEEGGLFLIQVSSLAMVQLRVPSPIVFLVLYSPMAAVAQWLGYWTMADLRRSLPKDRFPVRELMTSQQSRSFAWKSTQNRTIPTLRFQGKSTFDIPLIQTPPVSSRTLRKRLAEGHLGLRCPLRVLLSAPTHKLLRLEWCHARGNWTAVELNQLVFRDESRFNLSSDDNRDPLWRPRDEHLNPAFALQRHTAPTAGLMIWDTIAYNTRSPLVLIRSTT
ncbi:transposable element Tcb1 transposase [Trichonephila clavipes]|nr:transposable element Tcb1 transposase [Trichonephila clavipes]